MFVELPCYNMKSDYNIWNVCRICYNMVCNVPMFVELPCYNMKSDYNRFVMYQCFWITLLQLSDYNRFVTMFVELCYNMKSDYNRFVMYQCLSNYLVTIWNLIIIGL